MIEQLHKINNLSVSRYKLTLPKQIALNQTYAKAYMNHIFFWASLNKVILHSTSKKILTAPELYGSQNLALSCMAGQTPTVVKSKLSVAAFKVMVGALIGATCHIRKDRMQLFCYKWSFLAAAEELTGSIHTNAIGLKNVFIFELDQLDYKAFEPLPGLYIQFSIQKN